MTVAGKILLQKRSGLWSEDGFGFPIAFDYHLKGATAPIDAIRFDAAYLANPQATVK